MNEGFCSCTCVSTYVHFTLVNHIEVVSFIAWREERRRKEGVCERAEKKEGKVPGADRKAYSCYYSHLLFKFLEVDF